jgi:lipopolysaccharide transport system ATP-binding protein
MANRPIIQVEDVSKTFPLRVRQISLRQEAGAVMKKWLNRKQPPGPVETFYALKNVSFTVHRGETIAIIGRNGSGKSTLLRVITRIMRPTSGYASVEGRFAALIGLGAGFIPTMTGRENIYLNAAMHGIKKREIEARLESIIEFADLGVFIDQLIKDYSTGMIARLGFSIAIHILPDTIFLDEVLSVGDAAFQEKCMDRIFQLKEERKTIVFVSHSASAIRLLCERALWLDQGKLVMDGPTNEVLNAYEARFLAARHDP